METLCSCAFAHAFADFYEGMYATRCETYTRLANRKMASPAPEVGTEEVMEELKKMAEHIQATAESNHEKVES